MWIHPHHNNQRPFLHSSTCLQRVLVAGRTPPMRARGADAGPGMEAIAVLTGIELIDIPALEVPTEAWIVGVTAADSIVLTAAVTPGTPLLIAAAPPASSMISLRSRSSYFRMFSGPAALSYMALSIFCILCVPDCSCTKVKSICESRNPRMSFTIERPVGSPSG
mmetsp:Transcript_95495/g.165891  ORF Transcript_95495/g.165891 Transcript_95495/m.165891 type:complete len:165 (+) Transcript_95495:168-662(+)